MEQHGVKRDEKISTIQTGELYIENISIYIIYIVGNSTTLIASMLTSTLNTREVGKPRRHHLTCLLKNSDKRIRIYNHNSQTAPFGTV